MNPTVPKIALSPNEQGSFITYLMKLGNKLNVSSNLIIVLGGLRIKTKVNFLSRKFMGVHMFRKRQNSHIGTLTYELGDVMVERSSRNS